MFEYIEKIITKSNWSDGNSMKKKLKYQKPRAIDSDSQRGAIDTLQYTRSKTSLLAVSVS